MRSTTRPVAACATCRSRSTSCSEGLDRSLRPDRGDSRNRTKPEWCSPRWKASRLATAALPRARQAVFRSAYEPPRHRALSPYRRWMKTPVCGPTSVATTPTTSRYALAIPDKGSVGAHRPRASSLDVRSSDPFTAAEDKGAVSVVRIADRRYRQPKQLAALAAPTVQLQFFPAQHMIPLPSHEHQLLARRLHIDFSALPRTREAWS